MPCFDPLKATRKRTGGLRIMRDHMLAAQVKGKGKDLLSIPCGKCLGCRLDHAKMWMIRILHEAAMHEANSFLTLTYDEENLPHGTLPTLDPRDLQLFHKRARKKRDYRYFGSGEYGGENGRPHYHLILFGWRPAFTAQATQTTWTSDEASKAWPLGNVTVGNLTPASAAYVAQYVMKKQVGREAREAGRAPEFTTQSNRPGLGYGWLEKYGKELDRGYVVFEGRKVRLPRYYLEKKGDIDPEWYLMRKLKGRADRRETDFNFDEPRQLRIKENKLRSKRAFFGQGENTSPEDVT